VPDVNPWTNAARLTPVPGGVVTLVEGSTFAISDTNGDIVPPGPLGLFHRDTRFLSRLQLLVNGERPELLAARPVDAYSARFVLRLPWSGPGASPLVAVRSRFVGDGLHEDLDITNHGDAPAELRVEFLLDADFADLFEVKLGGPRLAPPGDIARRPSHDKARLEMEHGPGQVVGIQMSCRPDELSETGAVFAVTLAPGATWHTCFDVYVTLEGVRSRPKCRCDAFGTLSDPLAERAAAWRDRFPSLRSAWDALDHLYARSVDDLAALLMEDPDGAGDLVVAAGLPWFMALFGRDAILTALMALPFDRELAAGVLRSLARHQGEKEDEASEEQPGRIPHEMRFGDLAARSGRRVYYGTVDATPLFVTLVAEAWRWGLAWNDVEALLPNVRRALEWMRTFGDPDGDGYLEYAQLAGREGRPPTCPDASGGTSGWSPPASPLSRWTERSVPSTRSPPTPATSSGRASSRPSRRRQSPGAWSHQSCSADGACGRSPPPIAGTGRSPTTWAACGRTTRPSRSRA
jgi:glycogen debranching enzyme